MSLFSKQNPLKKSSFTKKRTLHMEALEDRQMLAIDMTLTGGAFDQAVLTGLQEAYPSLSFESSYNYYDANVNNPDALDQGNLRVVDASEFGNINSLTLQGWIATNDLIVIRADVPQITNFTGIGINGQTVTILVWNDPTVSTGSLELTSRAGGAMMNITGQSNVQIGGLDFNGTYRNNTESISVTNSTVNFDSVVFKNARGGNSPNAGGAMTLQTSTVTVASCQFLDNAGLRGGAVHQNGGTFYAYNTLFADNSALTGAAVFVTGQAEVNAPVSTVLVNCTVADNTIAFNGYATVDIQAGYNSANPTVEIYNTIFTNNGDYDAFFNNYVSVTIENTIRNSGTPNTLDGSFRVTNQFSGPQSLSNNSIVSHADLHLTQDYRLTDESTAAIDQIVPYYQLDSAKHIFDAEGYGSDRLSGNMMDVGAFEYQHPYVAPAYIAGNDVFDFSNATPVYDANLGAYTFAFSLFDIFGNDTYPENDFTELAIDVTNVDLPFEDAFLWNGGTITFKTLDDFQTGTLLFVWDGTTFDDTIDVFQYCIGPQVNEEDVWSNVATVSFVLPSANGTFTPTFIVTTCDDLDGDPSGSGYNEYLDPVLSLRQAVDLANANPGSIITFADYLGDGYVHNTVDITGNEAAYDSSIDLVHGQMNISSSVTIVGLGADLLTIDAQGVSRIFNIGVPDQVIDVTMSGLTLTNADAGSNNGGAINAIATNLILDSVTFISNGNVTTRGGAIYSETGSLTVSDSTFTSNNALYGGAVYRKGTGATASFTNVTFTDNIAHSTANDSGGGAIFLSASMPGTLTISGSTFEGNDAQIGGAVDTSGGIINVFSSIFKDNGSELNKAGGAINARSSSVVTISDDTTFTDNGNVATRGGAIYSSTGKLNLMDSTFMTNGALIGGAVYLADNFNSLFTNVTFESNTAYSTANDSGGGAIYVSPTSTKTLTISGSTFTGNDAENGGAINAMGGTLNVTGSTFTKNGNTVNLYGGAIDARNSTVVTISDNTGFTSNGNTATRGGAIFSNTPDSDIGCLIVTDSTFTSNDALYGGAVYRRGIGDTATFTGVTFINNMAHSTANDSGGGAIFLSASIGILTISGSTFEGNDAQIGGAIDTSGSTINIDNSSFIDNGNELNKGGGAINARSTTANVTISGNTTFINNGNIATRGGAIYSSYGKLSVSDSTFTSNNALYGGGVYANKSNVEIYDSIFEESNFAENLGSGIYATSGRTLELYRTDEGLVIDSIIYGAEDIVALALEAPSDDWWN